MNQLLADLPARARRAVDQLEATLAAGDVTKAREEIRGQIGMVTIEADAKEIKLYGERGVAASLLRIARNRHTSLFGSGGPQRGHIPLSRKR